MSLSAFLLTCASAIPPTTLNSIVHVESAGNEIAMGYLVRDNTGRKFVLNAKPTTKAEAQSWAKYLLERGYNFDAGIAQINSANFARFGLTAETVFDGCANLQAASTVLSKPRWTR